VPDVQTLKDPLFYGKEVEVNLQLTVSQSVCLGVWHQILLFPFFCQKIALLVLGRP
jgi:hypothetical protein